MSVESKWERVLATTCGVAWVILVLCFLADCFYYVSTGKCL